MGESIVNLDVEIGNGILESSDRPLYKDFSGMDRTIIDTYRLLPWRDELPHLEILSTYAAVIEGRYET